MAIGIAELEAACAKAHERIRALKGSDAEKLWEKEADRIERLQRKASLALGQKRRAFRLVDKAEKRLEAALEQINKVRKVKV